MSEPLHRILLAEDNIYDVEMTLAALNDHHLANEVVVVEDGAQVLDYLYARGRYKGRADGLPGLILLDLKMPKVDGLEVLRIVKGDPRLNTIPVVMLTSSKQEKDLVSTYQLGVNAYIVKPVDFMAFVEAIRQIGLFWAMHKSPPANY